VQHPSQVQPCVDAYRARYLAIAAAETTAFPGIGSLLDGLAGEQPLVVATSKPRALAEPLLEVLALRGYFAAVVGHGL
jgi:phosphoglycolate phosphatase-like HAD superfamily hydrolase